MAKTFDGMKDNGFKGEPSRFYETVPARKGDAKCAVQGAARQGDEGREDEIVHCTGFKNIWDKPKAP